MEECIGLEIIGAINIIIGFVVGIKIAKRYGFVYLYKSSEN